ncbi:MAG: TetR family transcriptional regulator [Hyphomicrobium sp.]|nr:TetR family transcriptional regulator [Hyphomicrobium sp.]PPD09436.1 MAG: TetR family transcriptional regulator [Hyphomicrobium sp.]
MLDQSTLKGRIIAATMRLAAEKPWDDVLMKDIAEAAAIDLAALRREFPSKPAILSAFMRSVDDAVLASAPKFTGAENARDRIFDVVMARFDVLAPYKEALKSIAAARPMDMELVRRAMASQAWMLHAAGVRTDGLLGTSRVTGMASVYASVMQTWLDDDDPGSARTMAALDRRLKRGEQSMRMLTDVVDGADRIASQVMRVLGCGVRRESKTPPTAPAEPSPSI